MSRARSCNWPLRKIVKRSVGDGVRLLETLECGHVRRERTDYHGNVTNAVARRCRECQAAKVDARDEAERAASFRADLLARRTADVDRLIKQHDAAREELREAKETISHWQMKAGELKEELRKAQEMLASEQQVSEHRPATIGEALRAVNELREERDEALAVCAEQRRLKEGHSDSDVAHVKTIRELRRALSEEQIAATRLTRECKAMERALAEKTEECERWIVTHADDEPSWRHAAEKRAGELATAGARLQVAEELAGAAKTLLLRAERNDCRHEETERSGFIWTICKGCDRKWADDEGGFEPYEEPIAISRAREALAAWDAGKGEGAKPCPCSNRAHGDYEGPLADCPVHGESEAEAVIEDQRQRNAGAGVLDPVFGPPTVTPTHADLNRHPNQTPSPFGPPTVGIGSTTAEVQRETEQKLREIRDRMARAEIQRHDEPEHGGGDR